MAISVIQHASLGTDSGNTLSFNFGSATTAGNCIIVCVGNTASEKNAGTVTALTLGTSGDTFLKACGDDFEGAEVWYDQDCSGGQTAVNVTDTAGNNDFSAVAYEISGLAVSSVLDVTATNNGGTSAWSSGSTTTTALASEISVGCAGFYQDISPGPTGPGDYANITVLSPNVHAVIAGYKILSSTGTPAYAGTHGQGTGATDWSAVVATFKAATAVTHMVTATDDETPAQTVTMLHLHYVTASQTVAPTQTSSVVTAVTASEAVVVTQSVTTLHERFATASEAITPTQSVTALHLHYVSCSQTVAPAQVITTILAVTAVQSVAPSQSVTVVCQRFATASQTIAVSQATTLTEQCFRTLFQVVSVMQSVIARLLVPDPLVQGEISGTVVSTERGGNLRQSSYGASVSRGISGGTVEGELP